MKVLVANRGEVAQRIIRTLKSMGLGSVAVYSLADASLPFVSCADESVLLHPSSSSSSLTYLSVEALLRAASASGASAVHPGYGFLSESAAFASAVRSAGLLWVGPSADVIRSLGSKRDAKRALRGVVPLIPGEAFFASEREEREAALRLGFPLLVKASAGGGGKGMRVVRSEEHLSAALHSVRREALSSFGDSTLLLERYFERVKHVEFQILGDAHGCVVACGERECSVQRRHQKVLEETPCCSLSPQVREEMRAASVAIGERVGYVGAGTVEWILDVSTQRFYFLEVNTRLQVEHTVTEQVTGLDLVECQLRVARGEHLRDIIETRFSQSFPVLRRRGHSLQVRVCAEDPRNGFFPSTGRIVRLALPTHMEHVRVDHSICAGSSISVHYDSMILKLVCWGEDRAECIARTLRALRHLTILGSVKTNATFAAAVLQHPRFLDGSFTTHFIADHMGPWLEARDDVLPLRLACTLSDWLTRNRTPNSRRLWAAAPPSFRNVPPGDDEDWPQYSLLVESGDDDGPLVPLFYRHLESAGERHVFDVKEGREGSVRRVSARLTRVEGEERLEVTPEGGPSRSYSVASEMRIKAFRGEDELQLYVQCHHSGRSAHFSKRSKLYLYATEQDDAAGDAAHSGGYTASMPATILKLECEDGSAVQEGDVLLSLESMKMELKVRASAPGVVRFLVSEAQVVAEGTLLCKVEPE